MFGLKINKVFAIALAICVPVGAWGVIAPDQMASAVLGFTTYFMVGASWWWLLLCTSFIIFAAFLAFSPYGAIKLGDDDEQPEFSTVSWIAMLFAGGMGAGLLFWGVAEPVSHFSSPPGMQGGTAAAAREAMVITNLHWGFHAWSIYGVCALVIAYFTFRLKKPPLISSPLQQVLRGRALSATTTAADVLGVVAVVFGLAGSLAMGALQVRSGLGSLFSTPQTNTVSLLVVFVLYIGYMASTLSGVDKGMRILSNLNMVIALAIMAYILIVGPTSFIMETFVDTIGAYLTKLGSLSFKLFPYEGLSTWTANWTLTYFIWWLAWGPFVGVFIARISRGRTIREFFAGVILVPTIFSIFWFAVFGGAGIYSEIYGNSGLSAVVSENVSEALFVFLDYFPFGTVLGYLGILLIFIFLITSADSGTFVLSMMTTDGDLSPKPSAKLVWGTLGGVITAATVLSGSVDVARAMATLGAIPFSAILILQIVGFIRAIREEDISRHKKPAETGKTTEEASS